MKSKKTWIIILITLVSLALTTGIVLAIKKSNEPKESLERKVLKENIEEYVAYVKINPSIKLDYTRKCTMYNDSTTECTEPEVKDYELVNDDAKEIFKDVDLLSGNKDLKSVIENICTTVEKAGIEVKDVSVQSDWNEINTYLTEEKKETSNYNENAETPSNSKTPEITPENPITLFPINTEVVKEEAITKTINEDVKAEEQAKEEAKAKAEAERIANTIQISKNVTYAHSMSTYECSGCLSTSLINQLKNAKGHYVKEATSSRITILTITSLSSGYNSAKFKGTSQLSKITAAGAEEVGGAGGFGEPLTLEVCKNYNLICE